MEKKLVLLAEDNLADEELTIRALKKSGIPLEIVVAHDGDQVLSLLFLGEARRLPDLVLLDLKLPKVNGLDVLARMRAGVRTRSIPVVIVSSSTKTDDVEGAYQSGCNGYLAKGVDYHQFVESARILALYWLVYNVPPVQEVAIS